MLGFFSGGIGVLSIGIAFHSADIANKSDKKMTALAELNFIEKNATICSYIACSEEIEIKDVKRIIRDLEATFKVVNWVKDGKTKENFIDAFIELTDILEDKKKFEEFEKPDKEDYIKLIENAKRFDYRIKNLEDHRRKILKL